MLERVRDFTPVPHVLVHFLTSPPFYLMFKQTLDASKSRLLTQSNGPDPPSNISVKIVQSHQAEDPADWFHSRRPTCAKTIKPKALPSFSLPKSLMRNWNRVKCSSHIATSPEERLVPPVWHRFHPQRRPQREGDDQCINRSASLSSTVVAPQLTGL